jgi:hypothetical protein
MSAEGLRARSARLLEDERAELQGVFGSSVDLGRVRVLFGGVLTVGGYARTLGNTIAFPDVYREGYRRLQRRCWLVHEATHVWQNQVLGKRYMPGAVWEHLTLPDPYRFELFPERRFVDYGYEAQASLIAELYRQRCLGMEGPERRRLEELLVEMLGCGREAGPFV